MRFLLSIMIVCFSVFALADAPSAPASPKPAASAIPPLPDTAPVVAPAPQPVPVVATVNVPADQVVSDPVLVPPSWLQTVVVGVKNLPYVGPVVIKVLMWAGVAASILTALCAFLLLLINTLAPLSKSAGLTNLAAKIQAFENSKVMYYLKYASLFNAQVPKA